MLGVGGQVRAGVEDLVVVVGVEVLGLEVIHDPDGGDGAGEFAEGVPDVGGLELHQFGKALVGFCGLGADGAALGPRTRGVRVEGAAGTVFALEEGVDGIGHRVVVRRAVGLEDILLADGVRQRPAFIFFNVEAEAGDILTPGAAKECEAVDAVEAPPAEPQRAEDEVAEQGRRHELRGGLGLGVLLEEGEGQGIVDTRDVAEFLDAGDLAAVDVVVNDVFVAGEEGEVGQGVLRQVGDRRDEQ